MGARFRVPVLPEWFRLTALNSPLSIGDVCRLFGFSKGWVNKAISEGAFPPPDLHTQGDLKNAAGFRVKHPGWAKRTILLEIKRRKEINRGRVDL